MRIIKNQQILQRQSDNFIKSELSNVATAIQISQVLVDWWDIDPDISQTHGGFKNMEEYIGPESTAAYHLIEGLPMGGIDNLVTQAQFDEEVGFDEDFQSNGVIFPNTIVPKPNSYFTIRGSNVTALYVVTNISPVTVRSNPFTEIQFRLYSRDPEKIKQLRRQTLDTSVVTLTAIGMNKTLIVKKEAFFTIQHHVEQYLELADMYKALFWDEERSAFIYDGFYDETSNMRISYLDVVLWRIMFDEGIIIYDDVITYANNNYQRAIPRIYTSSPDRLVDLYGMKQSILWRIYTKEKRKDFAQFKFPQAYNPDPRLGKFTGTNLQYFESYGDKCDCNLMCMNCPTWDDEFVARIRVNRPYDPAQTAYGQMDQQTGCCKEITPGVVVFNPYLRNAIIQYFNDAPIDWDNLEIMNERTCENYFLIPLLLGAYKKYIQELQK